MATSRRSAPRYGRTIDELKTFCARDSRCAGFYPCTVASGSSAKPCAHLATTTSARARSDSLGLDLSRPLGHGPALP
eukprot:1059116-Prymnesium_polylepis.1